MIVSILFIAKLVFFCLFKFLISIVNFFAIVLNVLLMKSLSFWNKISKAAL